MRKLLTTIIFIGIAMTLSAQDAGAAPDPENILVMDLKTGQVVIEMFAWTRALHYRGTFDGTPEVVGFADALEKVCIQTVESGQMTKDLALLIGPDQPWLTTEEFMAAIDANLGQSLN